MFLSRIELDLDKRKTVHALNSPQLLHKAVEGCFSSTSSEKQKPRKNLWRIDELGGKPFLLLVSPDKPDFSSLAKEFCKPEEQGMSKDYGVFLDKLEVGQTWQFRLTANPIFSSKRKEHREHEKKPEAREPKARGTVIACDSLRYQHEWLFNKTLGSVNSAKVGFDVLNCPVTELPPKPKTKTEDKENKEEWDKYLNAIFEHSDFKVVRSNLFRFKKDPKDPEDKKLELRIVEYEGLLTITDRALFVAALTEGIGRAKAYGCGLLTLARLK